MDNFFASCFLAFCVIVTQPFPGVCTSPRFCKQGLSCSYILCIFIDKTCYSTFFILFYSISVHAYIRTCLFDQIFVLHLHENYSFPSQFPKCLQFNMKNSKDLTPNLRTYSTFQIFQVYNMNEFEHSKVYHILNLETLQVSIGLFC